MGDEQPALPELNMKLNPLDLLTRLIRCQSVTPADDGAIELIRTTLIRYGFTCHVLEFGGGGDDNTSKNDVNDDNYRVINLFATIGDKCDPDKSHIAFAGHTDVVPPGDIAAWGSPPFAGTVVNDAVIGRGAVDMKGGIACFIAAVSRFIARIGADNINGSISLIITGDEEGLAINGTEKLMEWIDNNGYAFDCCLLGEPTCSTVIGDNVKIGRRGSVSGLLTIYGQQGHVAYPDLADNPINKLVAVISKLKSMPLDNGNDYFQPSNLEVTAVNTDNHATNVIPAMIKARFNIRFNDLWSADKLVDHLHRQIQTVIKPRDYELDITTPASEAFIIDDKALAENICQIITDVTDVVPTVSTAGGTSDARFIKDYCPTIEFGLCGATMHKTDEQVAVADLEVLTDIYTEFLIRNLS